MLVLGLGCLRRVVLVGVLLAAGIVLLLYRGDLGRAWRDVRGAVAAPAVEPSPELADSAEAKLAALSAERAGGRVALTEAEVQSLLEYRLSSFVPPYIVEPRIEIRGGRLRGQARVPTDRFGRMPEAKDIFGFLPDTAVVAVTGQLVPLDRRRVALVVDEVSAARIPLPRRLIPAILKHLGRNDEPGLPPDAWPVPLPAGASDAFLRGDTLVFLARSPTRHREAE